MSLHKIERYMGHALSAAQTAAEQGEVPVGAVVVYQGYIIGRGYNLRETQQRITAHAEILAIEEASRIIGSWRLENCDVYVTLEPCPMCAAALQQARVRSIHFGTRDPKAGALISTDRFFLRPGLNHYPAISEGTFVEACAQVLKNFFRALRARR